MDAEHDSAAVRFGKWIGAKHFDPVIGDQDLLRWAARLHRDRRPSPSSTFTLRKRFELDGPSGKQFHSTVVSSRCSLWIYADILSVEANVLRACSAALDACAPQQSFPKLGMIQKAASFIFIPHTIMDRCYFDIVQDVVEAFTVPEHRAIPPAICRLISGSRDLCFHYHMNGNLNQITLDPFPKCFFKETLVTGSAERVAWLEAYRQCLASIIETEGKVLMLSDSIQRVRLR